MRLQFCPALICLLVSPLLAEDPQNPDAVSIGDALPDAVIDGSGPGWRDLTEDDFENHNCAPDTWEWKKESGLHCTGRPVGVLKSKKTYTNFEMVVEWRHNRKAGNSGVFVWTTPESLAALKGPGLPAGIEVQVLDPGYTENYEKNTGKKADWFTGHGDVFPVRVKMTPFPPTAPNKQRSFPTEDRVNPTGEWNHYYIRAINGEVRLWVNGKEVSGGTGCDPNTGFLCLESEGSPIDFRNLRIRELP